MHQYSCQMVLSYLILFYVNAINCKSLTRRPDSANFSPWQLRDHDTLLFIVMSHNFFLDNGCVIAMYRNSCQLVPLLSRTRYTSFLLHHHYLQIQLLWVLTDLIHIPYNLYALFMSTLIIEIVVRYPPSLYVIFYTSSLFIEIFSRGYPFLYTSYCLYVIRHKLLLFIQIVAKGTHNFYIKFKYFIPLRYICSVVIAMNINIWQKIPPYVIPFVRHNPLTSSKYKIKLLNHRQNNYQSLPTVPILWLYEVQTMHE